MAQTYSSVLVQGPDGNLRQELIFTTSLEDRFFNGVVPEDAVSVEVSINGSGFSDDPALVEWGDGTWVVPSPTYEPNGLALLEGLNTIQIRAILLTGSTTNTANVEVNLKSSTNLNVLANPPTNTTVDQKNASVVISAEPSLKTGFIGMNFYASLNAGGGVSGYQRVNINLVREGTAVEEITSIANSSVDALVKVDAENNPVADPLFFRVSASQENVAEATLQEDYNEKFEIPETTRTVRMDVSLNSVRSVKTYSFDHNRNFGPTSSPETVSVGDFATLPNETPLYYVVTSIYFDSDSNTEYESSFSQEVVAHPLSVTTAIGSFSTTNRQYIVEEYITAIFRSNPQIKVEAGSVLRDTVIDPFSSEVERLRFVLDFYQRARTPTLLLQIDDPNGTGSSVPVTQSAYKQGLQQAFYLGSAQETQNLIDGSFDAYASNFGLVRRSGTSAKGEVIFFTTSRPTNSILIPLGTTVSGGGVQFSTTRAASISLANIASFFNPVTGRFQVTIPIRAISTGSVGNVGTGQINTLVSNLGGGVRVVNASPMIGGKDGESNLELTSRVQNTLASVDSGTERGYLQTAADVPGVIRANVVSAGDPLMQRDLDDKGEHKGGKVDVWVQGNQDATVTDVFSFTFEIARDIQFETVGDPNDLLFRAIDPSLSETNPIVELIVDVELGYNFINASTGDDFDITGATYPSFNTVQLSTSIPQPLVDLTDVILGSYRKRVGNAFKFIRQPVDSVLSVIGTVSGTLPESAYNLVKPNPPLETGNSTLAGDFLQIIGYLNEDGQRVPSGDTTQVTNEPHVLVGVYPEFLDNLGANFLSVRVFNPTRSIEYRGPNDPSGNPDFQITLGSETVPVSITRVEGGQISSGDSVVVDYQHDENFTVTYNTDLIVSLVQDAVDEKKHVTADVLAKKAIEVPLDVEATVIYSRGRDVSSVDQSIRTNIGNYFNQLTLGDPVRQSDVVNIIEKSDGVSYVIVPFTKMVRQEGSQVVREEISTDTAAESTLITSLTSNSAVVYILNNALTASTTDGGGSEDIFRGVFQDDIGLELLPASANLESLGFSPGRSYIIGFGGVSILGYSDDATLISQGYVTENAILQRRKQLTANKVLVSLAVGTDPTIHTYAATYIVGFDTGSKDIDPGKAEYLVPGTLVFTYDEDR